MSAQPSQQSPRPESGSASSSTFAAPGGGGGAFRGPVRPGMGPGMGALARAKNPRGALARLAVYFTAFRARLLVVAACVVVYTLLGLLGPYLLGVALDRFIATRDPVGLGRVAMAMVAAYVACNAFTGVAAWLMADLSQRALKALRRDLFAHLQRLPMAYFERHASGDLMSRLTNDISAINDAVAQNVTSLLASTLSMVGIVVAMFVLDRWLALASLLVVPIMLWFTRWVAVFTRRGFQQLQRDLGQLNGVMEESIGGLKVVKAFRRDESVVAAFREANERVYRSGVQANTYALLLMPLTTVLGNLFVIVLAGLGGWLALAGLVSVGVIAAFINYGQNFVQPLRQISVLYNTLQAALAGAERVFEVLDSPQEAGLAPRDTSADAATDTPTRSAATATASAATGAEGAASRPAQPVRGHVRFEHVSFGYRPDATVLQDVSLDAQPGQMVALVGPTGAGKTTIINLLTRFYEIDQGAILIDGVDIREIPKPRLRRMLGLVLQDTYLFGTTVLENIRYGRLDARDEDVVRAAQMADADHFIRQLPDGYDTVLSERAGNLSQGQRQLLAIARTLLAEPAILILDEATSSVDTRTEARIQRSLLRLMRGRTSFVIAHRLSTIRDADQVLVIDGGRVVERGTHPELLARRGVYRKLYESQFKGHAL